MTSSPEQNHNQEHTQQTANPVGTGNSPQTNSPIKGAKLPNFPPGLEIHNYVIVNLLGRGGMGVVYRAHHKILDKDLAIKFLKTESLDERAWERFKLEAKTLGRLRHRNLVGIHDLGLFQDTFPYYVMDLLDGESLFDLVRRVGPLTEEEVVEIFIQAAAGLACAHENGILHRDVKPANIVVTWAESNMSPVVKVVDFGLAKLVESNQSLTKTGEVNGSPLYMSPEQCEAGKLDERTDIYSLGCSMYEALTARVPFLGNSAFETMLMHQQDEPPTLAQAMPDLTFSPEIEAIIAKMLAKNKERRYQKMTQVIGDLRTLDAKSKQKLHPGKQTRAIKDLEEAEEELEQSKREKSAKFKIIAVSSFLGLLLFSVGGIIVYDVIKERTEEDETRRKVIDKIASIEEQLTTQKAFRLPFKDDQEVRFQFPETSIGRLKIHDGSIYSLSSASEIPEKSEEAEARGRLKCLLKNSNTPSKQTERSFNLEFQPNHDVLEHPEIMNCFQWNDLQSLILTNVSTNANEFLRESTHLKFLKEIECPGIKNSDIKLLESFPALRTLSLCGPSVTGSQLARLNKLTRIEKLNYENPVEIKNLLAALEKNSTITELNLSGSVKIPSHLTIGDCQQLAKLKSLQTLKLNHSNVNAEMLTKLSSLPVVKTLELTGCPLKSHATTLALLKWTALKSLLLEPSILTSEDKQLLEAKGLKISDTSSGIFQSIINEKNSSATKQTNEYLEVEKELGNKTDIP